MKRVPNLLSISRIPLAVALCLAASFKSWPLAWWLFIAAAFTDLVDGPLARKLSAVSQIGGRLDHRGDFALLLGTLTGLTIGRVLPPILLAGVAFGVVMGFLMDKLADSRGAVTQQQFAAGAIAFVLILLAFAMTLVSKAYGWQWWYIPIAAGVVGSIAVFKRGRLASPVNA